MRAALALRCPLCLVPNAHLQALRFARRAEHLRRHCQSPACPQVGHFKCRSGSTWYLSAPHRFFWTCQEVRVWWWTGLGVVLQDCPTAHP